MSDESCIRFAIDTGGTFTDIVVLDEGSGTFEMQKAATTPQNTLGGVLAAIDKAGVDLRRVNRFFVHGSTTALNALLERKGVPTAYITTLGFRDVPEIMRYNRPEMYNPRYHKPRPLVLRELRFEVVERMNARGEVITPLDEAQLRDVIGRIRQAGVAAIAVCFLHAFKNPSHERRARELILQEFPEASVAISSAVVAEHREFERSMTTIMTAYLAPVVERWIGNLQRELQRRGFAGEVVLTKSDGGGMTAEAAKGSPINMLLSGPAGGVIGGSYMARLLTRPNMITMDVGGTSFDIAMIRDGSANTQREMTVNRYPILISNLDIRTIGAGGGSLATIDSAGALHVGPQSAGAVPGPICYGRGGSQPTVTDAFLVNGYINAENFLGGGMAIDATGARREIQKLIATPLNIGLNAAASGILRIAMANMAEAIKSLASETGEDVRDYAMLCFGGGGPLFGAHLMDELEIPASIVPILPAAFSAWGMLMVDLRHDIAQTISRPLAALHGDQLESQYAALERRAWDLLAAERVPEGRRELFRSADMRYVGQEHSVVVPVQMALGSPDSLGALHEAFEKTYESVYGYRLSAPADVVTLRVKAIGRIPAPALKEIARGNGQPSDALKGSRQVHDFLESAPRECQIYDRAKLRAGDAIRGPALIEEDTTTTVIRHHHRCSVDRFGSLVIERM